MHFLTAMDRRRALAYLAGLALMACSDRKTTPPDPLKVYSATIFHKPAPTPNHLYIVGQVHRNPVPQSELERLASPKVAQKIQDRDKQRISAQTQIYRIGEYLNSVKGISLLLVEGRMENRDYFATSQQEKQASMEALPQVRSMAANDTSLRDFFDKRPKARASGVLEFTTDMYQQGYEDEKLYRALGDLWKSPTRANEPLRVRGRQISSAVALVNASLVIQREFERKRISSKSAMLVIGKDHLDEMIAYMKAGKASIPRVPELGTKETVVDLRLDEYNVTVLLPIGIK